MHRKLPAHCMKRSPLCTTCHQRAAYGTEPPSLYAAGVPACEQAAALRAIGSRTPKATPVGVQQTGPASRDGSTSTAMAPPETPSLRLRCPSQLLCCPHCACVAPHCACIAPDCACVVPHCACVAPDCAYVVPHCAYVVLSPDGGSPVGGSLTALALSSAQTEDGSCTFFTAASPITSHD